MMRNTPTDSLAVVVLEGLDNAWNPLIKRVAGIADDEYMWEPAAGCWTVRPDSARTMIADWADPDSVPAPVTTIAWRKLAHRRRCPRQLLGAPLPTNRNGSD